MTGSGPVSITVRGLFKKDSYKPIMNDTAPNLKKDSSTISKSKLLGNYSNVNQPAKKKLMKDLHCQSQNFPQTELLKLAFLFQEN